MVIICKRLQSNSKTTAITRELFSAVYILHLLLSRMLMCRSKSIQLTNIILITFVVKKHHTTKDYSRMHVFLHFGRRGRSYNYGKSCECNLHFLR